jgi:hypothetical protein
MRSLYRPRKTDLILQGNIPNWCFTYGWWCTDASDSNQEFDQVCSHSDLC